MQKRPIIPQDAIKAHFNKWTEIYSFREGIRYTQRIAMASLCMCQKMKNGRCPICSLGGGIGDIDIQSPFEQAYVKMRNLKSK